jgi:hypothetical protein
MVQAMLGFLVGIIIGFWAFFMYRDQVKPPSIKIPVPSRSPSGIADVLGESAGTFQLRPPKQSLRGVVKDLDGSVVISKRDELSGRQAVTGDTITDGESILTETDSVVTIAFAPLGAISLDPDSQISFVSTLPSSFLLEQHRGTVGYQVGDRQVITVRTQGIVFEVQGGDVILESNQIEEYVTVNVRTGVVKLAYLNAAQETQVHTVSKGETATIANAEFTLIEQE